MDQEEYKELQERYNALRELSGQVLVRYDDLLYKFQENEKAYNNVVHRLKLRESQLKEMKKLIQPAISEYEKMRMKYEIEYNCRTQAEILASKISTQNKELKRQSKMLLDLQGPNPPDITKMNFDLDEKEDSMEEYREEQTQKIQKLEEEVIEIQQELRSVREDLGIEKEQSSKWKTKFEEMKESRDDAEKVVAQYKEAMKDLSNVSEEAVREYEALQQKYELEQQCRSGAELFATEIRIQNEAMKKQSMILLTEAAGDPKLMMALHEVEQLAQELETQKQKYEREIQELKEAAEDRVVEEPDNSALLEEISQLETKVKKFEDQYIKLLEKYRVLEVKFEDAIRPPPPPPPPPPPSLTTKSKGFLSRLRKDSKKKKKAPTGVQNSPVNDTFSKAMSEMMERINSGKPLTPGAKPLRRRPSETVESETGAMKELNNILNKMKRTQSADDLGSFRGGGAGGDETTPDGSKEPTFMFTLKKRTPPDSGTPEKQDETTPDGSKEPTLMFTLKKRTTPDSGTPEKQDETTPDGSKEPALMFTLKKRTTPDSGTPEKQEEKPEFLTPSFKLKGGRLQQLLNTLDEDSQPEDVN